MSLNEIIGCVTMIVAIIGFVFSCYQWWKKVQSERAERLLHLIELLRKDMQQLKILYKIDYGEHWYDRSFHNSDKEVEAEVDRLLSFYEYILYLRLNHTITQMEFRFFEYDINRIVKNPDMQAYLFNLYHFSERARIPFSYKNILIYGEKIGCVDQSFFNKNTDKYPHFLNF